MRVAVMCLPAVVLLSACPSAREAFVPGQNHIQQIVVGDGQRAWINREPETPDKLGFKSVWFEKKGAAPQMVYEAASLIGGLAIATEGLYFHNGVALQFWAPDGGDLKELTDNSSAGSGSVVFDEQFVYFAGAAPQRLRTDAGLLPSTIQAVPRSGAQASVIYTRESIISDLAVDSSSIYWAERHLSNGELSFWSGPKTGQAKPTLLYTFPSLPRVTMGPELGVSDRLYFIFGTTQDCCPATLNALAKTDGAPTQLWSGSFPPGFMFQFDPKVPALYQATMNKVIQTIPLDGSPASTLATCEGQCTGFAIKDGKATWGDDTGIHPDL